MKRISPFYQTGVRVAASTTAQDVTNPLWKGSPTMVLSNIGTDWVYVSVGATADDELSYPIPPDSQKVITKDKDVVKFSVISDGSASELHMIASGEGI
jgi:hypothetical protein